MNIKQHTKKFVMKKFTINQPTKKKKSKCHNFDSSSELFETYTYVSWHRESSRVIEWNMEQ